VNDISVIEFYSRLGVNPYMYMGAIAAGVVVVFLAGAIVYGMISKSAFAKINSFDKDAVSIRAKLTSVDISRGERAKAVFVDENGEEYILIISKINAAFLTLHDEGELTFKGDRFVSFKRADEPLP